MIVIISVEAHLRARGRKSKFLLVSLWIKASVQCNIWVLFGFLEVATVWPCHPEWQRHVDAAGCTSALRRWGNSRRQTHKLELMTLYFRLYFNQTEIDRGGVHRTEIEFINRPTQTHTHTWVYHGTTHTLYTGGGCYTSLHQTSMLGYLTQQTHNPTPYCMSIRVRCIKYSTSTISIHNSTL